MELTGMSEKLQNEYTGLNFGVQINLKVETSSMTLKVSSNINLFGIT